MHVFLVLSYVAGLALGNPQYKYDSGVVGNLGRSAGNSGNLGVFSGVAGLGSSTKSSFGAGALKFEGGERRDYSLSSGSNGGASSFGGHQSTSNFNQYFQQQQQHSAQYEAPFVHKQFITVTAAEDNDSLEHTKHLVIGRPQKNYRIIFIRSPSSSSANVKLSAEYAPQEEKTLIYVLSKKDNSFEVSDIATPAPTVASKPEVFFIKYKTEQEAQQAQKQIQAEYDRLDGTSEHTDGGVVPQHSVIGILDGAAGLSSAGTDGSSNVNNGGSVISNLFVNDSNLDSTGSTSYNTAKSSAYLPPGGH